MDRQRDILTRRPSILDRPLFKAPKRDFTKAPSTLQNENIGSRQGNTQEKIPVSYNSGSKHTNPVKWQPYCTEIPAIDASTSQLSPSVTTYDPYSSQKSNKMSSINQQHLSQQASITILKPRTPGTSPSLRLPNPTKTHSDIPQRHPSPLPLSKIRALKSAYETLNPDKSRDSLDQIRLSRAIRFNPHLQGILNNMLALSELPFADEEDISSVQTSWIDSRKSRDERMAERLAQWDILPETTIQLTQPQSIAETPYIVRCGDQGSGLPILVRWTSTDADRYEIYHEHEPIPREVRYLLLEHWGPPFGDEGRDWEVDEDGRVWVRERPHRYNRWGRWWVLQSSGDGRTAR